MNLHSTMLLLYRIQLSRSALFSPFTFHYASTLSVEFAPIPDRPGYIYIPLCFYFILTRSQGSGPTIKFTFHYASTLLIRVSAASLAMNNLHSTMLLLYREEDRGVLFHMDLHSTMLLLYRCLRTPCISLLTFTFHYASTL